MTHLKGELWWGGPGTHVWCIVSNGVVDGYVWVVPAKAQDPGFKSDWRIDFTSNDLIKVEATGVPFPLTIVPTIVATLHTSSAHISRFVGAAAGDLRYAVDDQIQTLIGV